MKQEAIKYRELHHSRLVQLLQIKLATMVGLAAFLSLIFTTIIARLALFIVFGIFASGIYIVDSNRLILIEQELGSTQTLIPTSFKLVLKPYLVFIVFLVAVATVALFLASLLTFLICSNGFIQTLIATASC